MHHALHQIPQVHRKAGEAEAVLVQLDGQVLFHQAGDLRDDLCGQDGGVHIPHLGLRRDEMQGNAYGFFLRQVHMEGLPHLVQGLPGQTVFFRIQMPDIIGKRRLEGDAVPAPLNGKI